MRSSAAFRPGWILVPLALATACGQVDDGSVERGSSAVPGERPNVVIVLIDTLRADHTSLDGYPRETTPTLRAMASEGLTLRNHYSNAPWTKPSVASLLTGLHPTAHGSRVGQFDSLQRHLEDPENYPAPTIEILSPEVDTLAEILRSHGYSTHAFISNYHLTPKFGYDQGYDTYEFNPAAGQGGLLDQAAIHRTIETLRKPSPETSDGEPTRPLFIWTHLMSVHAYAAAPGFPEFEAEPVTPIDPTAKQVNAVERFGYLETAIAKYDTAIAYTDSLVGELYRFIRESSPNTILIVTSDHGEEFYEHGGFEHVRTLYDELLRIPFVAWGPGVPHGRLDGLSDTLDLLPTLLTQLGIPHDASLEGSVLYRDGELGQGKPHVFAEQHHRGPVRRFALVGEDQKLIFNQHKRSGLEWLEVYAREDRFESRNLARKGAASLDDPRIRMIEDFRARTTQRFETTIGSSRVEELDEYDLQQLREIGYVE